MLYLFMEIEGVYMKKIELLSPAGNMESLKAAIEGGCDAVYLAGKVFGARSFAGNFTNEELKEAVYYAHLYGVKVYVTVNTIIYEREVENFLDFIRYIHKIGVDAVIMQDLGMMDLVRKKFPNLEVHASTQMHIHNFEGAKFLQKLGIKRVVMARETPIEVIKKIIKELDIEVETFIHGALCISYSGQCLMSALIGNRSGNRGSCAQCCRKAYNLYDEYGNKLNKDNYLLSTKDLCTLDNIDKLIEIGVNSLKIEGRMKRPEYVYIVTKIYRKVIDNYYKTGKLVVTKEDYLNLEKIFNRSFTKGFMFGEENDNYVYQERPNHKGILIGNVISKINNDLKIKLLGDVNLHDALRIIDSKEDKGLVINNMFKDGKKVISAKNGDVITIKYDKYVEKGSEVLLTSDYNQLNASNEEIKSRKRRVLINLYVEAYQGKNLVVKANDGKNEVMVTSSFLVEKALNVPTTKEVIIKQLSKIKDTVYEINDIKINLDNNIFLNIKDINELRRNLIDKLNEVRTKINEFIEKDYYIALPDFKEERCTSVLVNNESEYNKYCNKADIIYTENKELLKYNNVVLKIPRVINKYQEYDKNVLIGELGSVLKYKDFETDFSFNVVNSYSLAFLHSIGAKKVTLSYELTEVQIKNIIDNYKKRYNKNPNTEVIVDSYPEAMISKFDLNKMYKIKNGYLVDEFNNKYKIESYLDFMKIYNYRKIVFDEPNFLYDAGVNSLRTNV